MRLFVGGWWGQMVVEGK